MPYPIILGGDHAAYEAEHAGVPDRERPDWPLPSFDAKDWAEAFCKVANKLGYKDAEGKPVDEGWMVSWFANALVRGYDERTAQTDTEAGAEAKEFIAAWMTERGYRTESCDTVADLLDALESGDAGRV